ncbi:MAG: Alanine-tRNA ligase [Candidatus Uhrbacteria bacterium GW2011_GWE2_45_35]|uniref:Alanine--tRNA ligase n=2 Tax=Candidatus Uhriibacteriota TaxID=1752732 RepID=A0A0G1JK99_9BACT|nr:MAG: Alanine-tRNA ligase [Candidatus Uhrbacteria bacterium GW2011_GWF2_44_350]KKU08734.1 MAG: Alanine-tRNA ligase [Candidatus Uhrbacteria bacterium GW2011_GWE2_45_35]HBR80759.1 alanine--tRNA ligase [Candidatus Uhrbacteria bacterium]HCU31878.1 alanine--tRNA ligase [Candidatus Uhrbacteria bacterium]
MTPNELRQSYLDFFSQKEHTVIPSASLVPENDPTVLFITAGMQPLVPFLLGEAHPSGHRLVDVQKCIRTGDVDEVGDNTHLTFFEMLGNWSLQDYFKNDSITWSFEFLTKVLNLPLEKLAFTVFVGEVGIPRDEESAKLWMSLGVPENRVAYLGREDNWWGPAGQTGPCGPDTEIFYWTGSKAAPEVYDPSDKRWVEIWNNVFMQYNKIEAGKYELLPKPNVDTGMGLERTIVAINGLESVYEIDYFQNLIKEIERLSGKSYQESEETVRAMRIIADHTRAATVIINDGIMPSNKDRGYILRRLIRRAVRYGRGLGIKDGFLSELAKIVVNDLGEVYSDLVKNQPCIFEALTAEENKFSKTLEKGLKEFEKMFSQDQKIDGAEAFILYSTYGFPLELTEEMARDKGQAIDRKAFEIEFKKHQDLSRAGAEQKFAGGLADSSEATTKLHTATHLLQAALRQVLGPHIFQRGSNITAERLRFDFSHPEKVTAEQLRQVEDIVNNAIEKKLPVCFEMLDLAEAKARGAIGVFEDKYEKLGGQLKVYTIGGQAGEDPHSREVCGGPHVENIGNLGRFKIIKEEAVSAGVRRIKAVLEPS